MQGRDDWRLSIVKPVSVAVGSLVSFLSSGEVQVLRRGRIFKTRSPSQWVLLLATSFALLKLGASCIKGLEKPDGLSSPDLIATLLRSILAKSTRETMSWLGFAGIRFTHSPKPLSLRTKDGKEKSLAELCEESTPPCRLNPLLFNGHLQTMWTAVKTAGPPIYYRRRIFDAPPFPYVGTFAVDFAVPPHQDVDDSLPPRTAYYSEEDFSKLPSDDSRPMLICLHGLSGGSYELYLRAAIEPLLVDGSDWEVIVVNSRGCANSAITSGVLFNARATWDVRQVVKWARQKFPNRPLFGVGFSLGANILTNYVGEEGASCPLKAAIAVASPFNLDVSNKALQRSTVGLQVYSRVMGTNLKKLIANHKESLLKHSQLDFDTIERITFLHEFDRAVQCPSWGYPSVEAYYRDASSCDAVLNIRIPYFAISAGDDPIAVDEAVPYEDIKSNPYTVHCSTALGGHLSWFEIGGGRWHARPIVNFLKNFVEKIDLNCDHGTKNGVDNFSQGDSELGFNPLRHRMKIATGPKDVSLPPSSPVANGAAKSTSVN